MRSEPLVWTRPGLDTPTGWPHDLLEHVSDIEAGGDDVIWIWDDVVTAPRSVELLVRHAGLRHWAGLKLLHRGELIGLLCFERQAGRRSWLGDTVGLLRLSASMFGNALVREHSFRERAALEERLNRSQRLETVGTLTSGIAHNFNNVLGVMLGHAELAYDNLEPRAVSARHVGHIMQAGERARDLVEQILDFGRRSQATRRPIPIDQMVAETMELVRASLPNKVQVTVEGDAGGACVMGEAAQLQQVLVNLVRNAAEASEPGQSVSVAIDALTLQRALTLSHGDLAPDRYVRIRVVDQGIGIDQETLANLFQPFFTTRPAGTGLGLATARELVRDYGGAFDVRSVPGKGSSFEVWLPATDSASRPEQGGVQPGRGEVIMLVGGDRRVLYRDEEMLAALDYEPIGFSSTSAALEAIRAEPDRFDLVIVEQSLPDMNGIELAARLRKLAPRRPILMTGSDRERLNAKDLAAIGIEVVLGRPWRSGTIASALGQA
jgi:signal transduction histidine kinase